MLQQALLNAPLNSQPRGAGESWPQTLELRAETGSAALLVALLLHTQSIYFNVRTSAFPGEKRLRETGREVKPLLVQASALIQKHLGGGGGLSSTAPILFLWLTLTFYFLDSVCALLPSTFCTAEDGLEILIFLILPPKCWDWLAVKCRLLKS